MLAAKIQAIYFILMGLWPLLHLRSFEAITGAKHDKWLVKTIAWLFAVIGLQLWFGDPAIIWILGLGSALTIGVADFYYSLITERISWIYTVDVAPQLAFVVLWLAYLGG